MTRKVNKVSGVSELYSDVASVHISGRERCVISSTAFALSRDSSGMGDMWVTLVP